MVYDVTIASKMRLAKRYMTPAWGLVVILPSIMVPCSYATSLPFNIAETVAWAYWMFVLYRIEFAMKKLDPVSQVLPRRAWLLSMFLGAHPLNYFLLIGSCMMLNYQGTAMPLAIVTSVGVMILLSVAWYSMIFTSLRRYINNRLPEPEQLSKAFEYLISFGICAPSAVGLMLLTTMFTELGQYEYLRAALVSSGLLLSLGCTSVVQHKLAEVLSLVKEPSLEDLGEVEGIDCR
ncbi:MAG TPA: hypothetical protein V6C86_27200 [Oculatellaceae cyanobacterium]